MKREKLLKFFTACAAIAPDGQITFKDGQASMAHTCTAGVSLGYIKADGFDVPDGIYGLNIDKIKNFIAVVKNKEGDFNLTEKSLSIKFELKRTMRNIALGTLRPIRPYVVENMTFPCKIEIDKTEFISIIDGIDKTMDVQNNTNSKIELSFNGKELNVKTADNIDDCIERPFEIISVEKGKGEKFVSYYPYDYLKNFSGVFKKIDSSSISLSFGNGSQLLFNIKDDDVDIEYVLAPIVEGD